MIVFAIDPGTIESAWIIWDSWEEKILNMGIAENHDLLDIIASEAEDTNGFAIEMIASYGMPVGKETFETCLWIGRFIQQYNPCAHTHAMFQVYRIAVKSYLCHSAKAKDGNVRQALIDRFGEPGTKKDPGKLYGVNKDIWSALAVAVYFADAHNGGSK